MKYEFFVGSDDQGKRLDKFLCEKINELSRQKIIRAINQESVLIDGDTLVKKAGYKVIKGQNIVVCLSQEKKELLPCQCAINILYEDEHIIVVEKPNTLATHPPHYGYNETLVNALLYMGKPLYACQELRPGIVHRLDKETSGVIVAVKSELAYNELIRQFKERLVKKEYRALCHGIIQKDFMRIDLPLARDARNRLKMKVSLVNSKEALTEMTVIKRFEKITYVSLKILTGKMHQIRVHLNFFAHPILGDKKYGIKDGYDELFLHAHKLGFFHPMTKEFLEFQSPLPKRFNTVMDNFQ